MATQLFELIDAERDAIVACMERLALASNRPSWDDEELRSDLPSFLRDLTTALARAVDLPDDADLDLRVLTRNAAAHGRHLQRQGCAVATVVYSYGDVCQAVTKVAASQGVGIRAEDFQLFNRCIDAAIVSAVEAYEAQRELDLARDGSQKLDAIAKELRAHLRGAIRSFEAIQRGAVGISSATSAVHLDQLTHLRALVDRLG